MHVALGSTCVTHGSYSVLGDYYDATHCTLDDKTGDVRVMQLPSSFGGLRVACWPLVPKFAGSKPGRSRRIFQGEKILSTLSFAGEVKPSVPCRRFTACKRFLNATWKSGISGKIHRPFLAHIVPPLATRISGRRLVMKVGTSKNNKV